MLPMACFDSSVCTEGAVLVEPLLLQAAQQPQPVLEQRHILLLNSCCWWIANQPGECSVLPPSLACKPLKLEPLPPLDSMDLGLTQ